MLASDRRLVGRGRENRREANSARSAEFEQRLVEKVKVPVLLADVHDEGHRRTQPGDVAEILFGADANVDALRAAQTPGVVDEVGLVGDQVFGNVERSRGSDRVSLSVQKSGSLSDSGSAERRAHALLATATQRSSVNDGAMAFMPRNHPPVCWRRRECC